MSKGPLMAMDNQTSCAKVSGNQVSREYVFGVSPRGVLTIYFQRRRVRYEFQRRV